MAGDVWSECRDYVLAMCKGFMEGTGAYVSVGGSKTGMPRELLVRDFTESDDATDVSTSRLVASGARGCVRVRFNVAAECWAQSSDRAKAVGDVMEWASRLYSHVAADKTLGGLCVHARPYRSNGTVAVDAQSRLFTAYLPIGVTVDADIDPSREQISENGE